METAKKRTNYSKIAANTIQLSPISVRQRKEKGKTLGSLAGTDAEKAGTRSDSYAGLGVRQKRPKIV